MERWLRRYRRHGRAARRPLLFRRPPRRHHQCRRAKVHPEEVEAVINRHPGVRCRWCRPQAARSPARSWWRTWCWPTPANDTARFKDSDPGACRDAGGAQSAGMVRVVPALASTRAASWPRHAISPAQCPRHRRQPRHRPGHRPKPRGGRLSRVRAGAQGERRADAAIAAQRAGALHFVPFDLQRPRRHPRLVRDLKAAARPVLRAGEQRGARHRGPALHHARRRSKN